MVLIIQDREEDYQAFPNSIYNYVSQWDGIEGIRGASIANEDRT